VWVSILLWCGTDIYETDISFTSEANSPDLLLIIHDDNCHGNDCNDDCINQGFVLNNTLAHCIAGQLSVSAAVQ